MAPPTKIYAQRFQVTWVSDGSPVVGRPYEIWYPDGGSFTGQTDARGCTLPVCSFPSGEVALEVRGTSTADGSPGALIATGRVVAKLIDGGIQLLKTSAKRKKIRVLLTFDDGPAGPLTVTAMNALASHDPPIKAAFFIQTHVASRLASPTNKTIVKQLSQAGHSIQIHTGSDRDHVPHTERVTDGAYDVDHDDNINPKQDGTNALESDLLRAKARIKEVTGIEPQFVRAPYGQGYKSSSVASTYSRASLKHIFWHVDSGDSHKGKSLASISGYLRRQPAAEAKDFSDIIVLFHDIHALTVNNLTTYIGLIQDSLNRADFEAQWPASREEVDQIMNDVTEY